MTIRDLLAARIPAMYRSRIPTSFDVIGSREKAVAIVEIPDELKKYKTRIASAIMKQHKNVRSVLDKGTPRKGIFRIRDYKLLAGDRDTEVMHNESGCRFLIDPRKAYFSQREGTERLRIASLVKNNELVMVLFAGVGPFPVIISRKTAAGKITGIEINPAAAGYFRKNVLLNKCRNVEVIEDDVRNIDLEHEYDRVIMPLPEKSIDYLPEAFQCLKPGGIIHFYFFADEAGIQLAKAKIRALAKKSGRKISFLGKVNVLPYGPRIWKMRLDIRVT